MPAVLPSRITPALVRTLARFHPLFVNTHFNHPRELTEEAVAACGRLVDAGIPLGNQTVLLAGVNDRADVMCELMRKLVKARVRPYYLFQCDLTEGVEHLRTPLSKGIEIMEALRGRLSGIAIPTFVVDGPHGLGKVPIVPNYVISQAPGRTVLRNFAGKMVIYPDPVPQANAGEAGSSSDGVAGLLSGAFDIINGTPYHDPTQVKPSTTPTRPVQRSASSLRIGLAFNLKRTDSAQDDGEAEFDSPRTINALEEAIRSFEHEVVRLEANASFPVNLAESKPDLVFNIAEGFHGRCREAHVPAVCEMLGIEYTGSDPLTLSAGLDKAVTKRLLKEASVATPAFFLVNGSPSRVPSGVSFPVIVKPNAEGSSKGIGVSSVARSSDELSSVIAQLRARYGRSTPLIVEKFVYGREVTVGLLVKNGKLVPFDPMEVVFLQEDSPRVYSYDLKQDWAGKLAYQCPAKLEEKVSRACKDTATKAALALGCRDIARVDLRLDEHGKPWVIEINPLPGLTPNYSDMLMIAEAAGLSYRDVVGRVLEAGISRAIAKRKK
jgi:D-alanine--D-alanine ligase